MLMFAELLADGQNVDRFDAASCSQARTYIASGLLRGLRHTLTKIPKGQAEIRSRPTTETICSRASTTTDGTSQSTFVTQDIRSAANDWDIALASLADGVWLTDTVLVQYFQSLAHRSLTSGTAYNFYSLHVLNRLYDDKGKTIRSHLQVHDGTLLSPAARAELATIRAMHGYDEIFACARAYYPVALTNHYCLLEVDNGHRTITYMDTLYAGRSTGQVARALADYLLQYEQELTGGTPLPWK